MKRRTFLGAVSGSAAAAALPSFAFSKKAAPTKPNILWITSEDNGISWVSCYGATNCKTPAIDQLAKEGFRYTHCFDNAAVCAPTRSTWITGMMAISNGTQPMRSRNAVPHDTIKYYPDLLREAGYHCTNPGKTDYNIGGRSDRDCWEDTGKKARYGWQAHNRGQPFFAIVNLGASHESRAHGSVESTRNDPATMTLHAYHPDLPAIRKNYAKYADAVEKMDGDVANCIAALKKDGLYEDTIIIYCSDHGGVLPRSKRFLYSSGTHCPLVIRIPEKWKSLWPAEKPGMAVDRIVSFVDMPKTWVSLAGGRIAGTLQGRIFLGPGIEKEPDYHLSFRERADERLDCVRMIRDRQYAYMKNYMPYVPAGQHLSYLWRAAATRAWEQHHREGRTNEVTGRFFRPRVSEEFYDTVADFDNVINLIDKKEHQDRIRRMKKAMRQIQLDLYDSGMLPETMRSRRAAEHNLTIYEMVRRKDLYPLEAYLDAADRALERDKSNRDAFVKQANHADEGIRYWSICGLFMLGDDARPAQDILIKALGDSAYEVSSMAAWALVRLGSKERGYACLRKLLQTMPESCLTVFNIIDWMDDDGRPLISAVKATSANAYDSRLASYLLGKFKEPA